MRATDLLGMEVADHRGIVLGQVLDALYSDDGFALTALLVGAGRRARLAAATGAAQGRLAGPAVIRRYLASASVHRIPVERVGSWGPARVELTAWSGDDRR
jgi:sporulation protein YlmC with PRC-barrel domain